MVAGTIMTNNGNFVPLARCIWERIILLLQYYMPYGQLLGRNVFYQIPRSGYGIVANELINE